MVEGAEDCEIANGLIIAFAGVLWGVRVGGLELSCTKLHPNLIRDL